jgi:Chemoreceptor zinc-binding domain
MNFEEAIQKHAEWKIKFRSAMGKKEKLDATTICADNKCALGIWLHGEGKRTLDAHPAFADVLRHHAEFHRAAGAVAAVINAGDYEKAEKMLTLGTPFASASSAVGTALMSLKRQTAQA